MLKQFSRTGSDREQELTRKIRGVSLATTNADYDIDALSHHALWQLGDTGNS